MPLAELDPLLEHLRAEIGALSSTDDEARLRLEALVASIETKIDEEKEDEEDLLPRLQDAIERLEVEHPAATEIINKIVTLLSGAGL